MGKRQTVTGGRAATTGVITGSYALSVGNPETPAPPGWRWTLLTDVARLETGHTPSRRHPEYWDGDIPWIGIRDATAHHGETLGDTDQHVTQAGIDNSSARILPQHTVCLSRTASVGYVVVTGVPMATSQDFVNWVCSPDLDWRFLKYVLLAERDSFGRFASGTTHQTIYFPEVKAFHICLPPIDEQRRIADMLGALDDKIELDRRLATSLEALGRLDFQRWKATQEKAALRPLHELCDILSGGTPSKASPELWAGDIPWISPKVMNDIHADEAEHRVAAAAVGSGTRLAPRDSTLVMVRGMGLHERVRVSQAREDVTFNQDVKALVPRAMEPALLLFAVLDAQGALLGRVESSGHGTGVLPTPALADHLVPVPSTEAMARIADRLAVVNDRIGVARGEARTLSAIRDRLLPRLLDGSLDARAIAPG